MKLYAAQQAQTYYSTIEKAGENYLASLTFDEDGYLTKISNGTTAANPSGLIAKSFIEDKVKEAVEAAKTAFGAAVASFTYVEGTNDTNTAVLASLQEAYVDATTDPTNGKITDAAIIGNSDGTVSDDLLAEQLKADQKAANEALATYNPDLYSDDINEYAIAVDVDAAVATGCGYTYEDATGLTTDASLTAKEFVTKVINTQSAVVANPTGADDSAKITAVRKAAKIAKEVILGHKKADDSDYYIAPVKTLEDLKADTSLETAKAAAISQVKATLASKQIDLNNKLQDQIDALDQYATLSDANKKTLAELKKQKSELAANFAAAEEAWTALINYQDTTTEVAQIKQTLVTSINAFDVDSNGLTSATKTALDGCVQVVDWVADIKADAALLAQQKDVNGKPYYDADVLNANLEKAVKYLYTDGSATYAAAVAMLTGGSEVALVNAKIDYIDFITGEAQNITPKDSKGKEVSTMWNKASATASVNGSVSEMKNSDGSAYTVAVTKMYDKAQKAELKTLVDETKAAIEKAATIGEIEKIFAEANDKYNNIPTTKDHFDAWAASGKVGLAYNKADYDKELNAYATYFTEKVDLNKYPTAVGDAGKILKEVAYPIVYEAYTVDELAGKVAEAKAAIDKILSTEQVKAEKTAVENTIKALPTTVTLADKDAIVAAADALDAYNEIPGSAASPVTNDAVLTAAEKAYEKLAAKELDAAYDALAAKKTITTDDAAAIEALRTLYDDYADFCKDYNGGTQNASTTDTMVEALETKLSTAKVNAVKEMMIKLPANPTEKDRAAVEAARAAYEALTLAEKKLIVGTLPYQNLIDAEEALGLSKVISVEALKITASSTAAKGSITIKWTVKGDTTAVEAFEIWKSTKQSSGFKKSFTTTDGTKRTYKNTKELKKGTRYYYKVRAIAYDANGKKITSDWSNKAYRIAK